MSTGRCEYYKATIAKRKPRLTTALGHDSRLTTHDCHDCTTHDCQVFTTTTEAGGSTTHDHDWFQSLIIIPEIGDANSWIWNI